MDVLEPWIKGQGEPHQNTPNIISQYTSRKCETGHKIGLMYKAGSILAKYSSTHKRVRTLRSDADPLAVFRLFPQVE